MKFFIQVLYFVKIVIKMSLSLNLIFRFEEISRWQEICESSEDIYLLSLMYIVRDCLPNESDSICVKNY